MYESREPFEARIYTPTYRAYGFIHLAPEMSTEALLNSVSRSLLPVTDPLIYAPGHDHPPAQEQLKVSAGFLAIHYDQISWVVGGQSPARSLDTPLRRLAFLSDGYVLVGHVRVPAGTRSSDFLESAATFQTLFDAELYPWRAPTGRFLLLGRDSDSLFEVGASDREGAGVRMLEAQERFSFLTVNLSQVTGVLEAFQTDVREASSNLVN